MTAGQTGASCDLMYVRILKAVKLGWHAASSKTNRTSQKLNYGILITHSKIFPFKLCMTKNSCLPSNIYMMSWSNFLHSATMALLYRKSHSFIPTLSPYYRLFWGINRSFPQYVMDSKIQLSAQQASKNSSLMKRCYWPPNHGAGSLSLVLFVVCCCLETSPQGKLPPWGLINK